jgi:hypothetical protein
MSSITRAQQSFVDEWTGMTLEFLAKHPLWGDMEYLYVGLKFHCGTKNCAPLIAHFNDQIKAHDAYTEAWHEQETCDNGGDIICIQRKPPPSAAQLASRSRTYAVDERGIGYWRIA